MITKDIKANAIAKMRFGLALDVIQEELDIPLPLLREWYDNLDCNDLTQLSANMYALSKVASGEILPSSANQEQMLKMKCEEVAIEIVEQINLTVSTGDIVRAKTLQLCADTVTKLYNSIITKVEGSPSGETQPTLFSTVMRD